MSESIDQLSRRYTGVKAIWVVVFVTAPLLAGGAIGWFFPRFEATAMLQFPEEKHSAIDFRLYKRVAASYDSKESVGFYIDSKGGPSSDETEHLRKLAQRSGFWNEAVVPALPFNRRDQKEFGDIRDAAAITLLGIDLKASASTESVAAQTVKVLADYIANALIRERVRSWALEWKAQSLIDEKSKRAEVLRAKLDIELATVRASDMRAIIARYPDAARMDVPQVLSVSGPNGAERFLSPLAQLVGAESTIAHQREQISRLERVLQQRRFFSTFFAAAEPLVSREPDITKALTALDELARHTIAKEDIKESWVEEAALEITGAIQRFAVMRNQTGIRTNVRINAMPNRAPLRLALLGTFIGAVLLCLVVFIRRSVLAVPDKDRNESIGVRETSAPSN